MKKKVLGLIGASVLGLSISPNIAAQTTFPSNPQKTNCSISKTDFAKWFAGGTIRPDGMVDPADSLNFPADNTACDFYKWSSQMFLWLTSPASGAYGGGGFVFDSGIFYDVSPEVNGQRHFISNVGPGGAAAANSFNLRFTKPQVIGEVGQAGSTSDVLMSQGNSLVYYGLHANDVFAYFLTGLNNNAIDAKVFPDSKPSLQAVMEYGAKSNYPPLRDPKALAMELKTSWVEATSVSDPSRFIQISAVVPRYDTSDPKHWVMTGTRPATLALVGMHVVGTVNGHPEMVWATIEHVDNAPNGSYYYTTSSGANKQVPFSSAGSWTFTQTGATEASSNTSHMTFAPAGDNTTLGDIVSTSGNTISPSNTYLVNPLGSAPSPSQEFADNNAQLISLNNDVMAWLDSGDVRKNYYMSGALWTQNGNLPYFGAKADAPFTEKGSLSLANTTMETYNQQTADPSKQKNTGCFQCHSVSQTDSQSGNGLGVSHIFATNLKLPNGYVPANLKK